MVLLGAYYSFNTINIAANAFENHIIVVNLS